MTRGLKPKFDVVQGGLSEVPPPPSGLNAVAREEWRRTCAELIELRGLAQSDLLTIEMYATARAMVRKLRPLADKADPFIINEKSGGIRPHPAHSSLSKFLTLCLRYESELGLTPAARNRKGFQKQGSKADEGAPTWLDL